MTLELIEPVKKILNDVETATGKSVKFVEKEELGVLATVKLARRSMSAHIILYKRQHDQIIINHLVAHECGHILRMFGVSEEKRLIPSRPKDSGVVLQELDRDLKRLSSVIPLRDLTHVISTWRDGLIMQLTNYPPDIMIEKWIYDGYPELRKYQLTSLEKQLDQAIGGLARDVQMITPPKVYNASNMMNYAFFNILGDHLKIDLGKPYRNTPFMKKGKQLVRLTEKDYVNTYDGDVAMINRWAEFLGLSKWFDWVGFEDMPQDYLNSV